jgi:SAM-dependent methyltransferase
MSQMVAQTQAPVVGLEQVEACPVCASVDYRAMFATRDQFYGLPGEFDLVACSACELVYLRTRPDAGSIGLYYPSDSYYAYKPPASYSLFWRTDRLAAIWYAMKKGILARRYNYRHLGGSQWLAGLAALPLFGPVRQRATFGLEALLHPYVEAGSLLEVGCGSGMYLDLMRALGWSRVVGVDINARAIQQARDELGIEAYCGNLRDAHLEASSFDAVSLSHTLEHVPEPVEFLREVNRLMKPGARLAVIVPNMESRGAKHFGAHWYHLDSPRHMVNFHRRSLSAALARAGFQLKSLKTSSRISYQTALFSYSRKAGDDHSVYANAAHRFPASRQTRARLLAGLEHAQCAFGLPAGEELMAVAIKSN